MLSRIRTTLAVIGGGALVLAAMGAAGPASGGSTVGDGSLTLRDQYGETGGLARDASGLQVAIVVSAKRLRRIKAWEQAIREVDVDVPVIRVADVPRTAPTEYEVVAEKLRKRLPGDVNVLIDLDGVWMRTFGLDTSVPNVLIFDGTGELLASHQGNYRRDQLPALAADLAGGDDPGTAEPQ